MSLHADVVCAAAETYIGLVEAGIGVIPGGGGTKEFALRAADEMHEDEPDTITLTKPLSYHCNSKGCHVCF